MGRGLISNNIATIVAVLSLIFMFLNSLIMFLILQDGRKRDRRDAGKGDREIALGHLANLDRVAYDVIRKAPLTEKQLSKYKLTECVTDLRRIADDLKEPDSLKLVAESTLLLLESGFRKGSSGKDERTAAMVRQHERARTLKSYLPSARKAIAQG